jgi:DNA-binding Xre family transcriptional regulator
MRMRIRLPELLDDHKTTAYDVAQRSNGRINASALYRLVRQKGRVRLISSDLLEALCDVLPAKPEELLEREKSTKRGKK